MRANVFKQANDFASSQGKVAIPVAVKERPLIPGAHGPSVELQFRIVAPDDPEAKKAYFVSREGAVLERKSEKIDQNETADTRKAPTIYEELIKLDELRKKGIITDEEFAAQKKKLLAK